MKELIGCFKNCELCNDKAVLFCPSDSAFLCYNCDSNVHQANFLVARHLRFTLCSHCNSITKHRFLISPRPLCPSCSCNSPADDDDSDLRSLSSSSSTCISSTSTYKNTSSSSRKLLDSANDLTSGEVNSTERTISGKLRDPRANYVFEHWCTKLGLMYAEESAVVETACAALDICLSRFRALPLRVCLAVSLWFGLRSSGDGSKYTRRCLRRLEEISGVPVKLMLASELKLRQIVKTNNKRRRQGMEESWDECSP